MPRALLIDDNDQVRLVFAMVVEDLGFEVAVAENGDLGLALFEAEPFDLVITDLRLPGRDGIEVARAAISACPSIPVLVISGNIGHQDEKNIDALGAAVQCKPITSEQLADAIERAREAAAGRARALSGRK